MTRMGFVILSYNSFADAARLGARIRDAIQGTGHLVILVDNASPDRTGHADWRALAGVNVHCIEAPRNRGYSAGNNIGIDHAIDEGIDDVVVLNPDVAIDDVASFVETLRQHFESDDFLCLAVNIRGIAPYYTRISFVSLLFPTPFRLWDRVVHAVLASRSSNGSPRAVGRVHGCAFALRARAFRALGLFDERLFLYGEEAVVSIVARRARKAIVQSARAEVVHGTDASLGTLSLSPYTSLLSSIAWILRAHYGLPAVLARAIAYVPVAQLLASRVVAFAVFRLRR